MDPRIDQLRSCSAFLSAPHGGDREARCLVDAVRACLELAADILARCGQPPAKGYRDAVDKMVACGAIDGDLATRLTLFFDVAERLPAAWSTVAHDAFEATRAQATQTLLHFAAVAERQLGDQLPAEA